MHNNQSMEANSKEIIDSFLNPTSLGSNYVEDADNIEMNGKKKNEESKNQVFHY